METGYADLFPNNVSWVLSEEMIIGMIVAPGYSFSTSAWKNVKPTDMVDPG
jgi:hypothetical protein